MRKEALTLDTIQNFQKRLLIDEKSKATVGKYIRDVKAFNLFIDGRPITKELVVEYKKYLIKKGYAVSSINSMLASVNSLLVFIGCEECKVKSIRKQQKIYCEESRELTKDEYLKLLKTANGNERLERVLQTICGTGIRISELMYFTVEAVDRGEIIISCKNKTRTILIPGKLRKILLNYANKNSIYFGIIFRTKTGKPLDRSNIWRSMKKLCEKAGVQISKVFPHNFRKLFAKTYYNVEKDIAKLADILGHSNINTTRIYIMTSGVEHRKQIESLGLVFESNEIIEYKD